MRTTESANAPAARGIHRRADFARMHAAAEAARDYRYAASASIFVFILSVATLEPVLKEA